MSAAVSFAEAKYYGESEETFDDVTDRKVVWLRIDDIKTNPFQPRKIFTKEALTELSESIREYGVLQPITVRRVANDTYELIAGERRLRASKMADLQKIPAIIYEFDDDDSAVIALIENLQRESLSFLEEAEAYYCLVMDHGITQEQLAQKVGKSQSTIANKVRLLKLPPLVQKIIHDNNLTERHARCLLKIEDEEIKEKAIKEIISKNLNVSQTEVLIMSLMGEMRKEIRKNGTKLRCIKLFKDLRIFSSTINQTIDLIKQTGLPVMSNKNETDDYIEYTIRVEKKA